MVEFDVRSLAGCDVTAATLRTFTRWPDDVLQTRVTFYAGDGAPTLSRFADPNGVGSILFSPQSNEPEVHDVTSPVAELLSDGATHVGALFQQDPLRSGSPFGKTYGAWGGIANGWDPLLRITCAADADGDGVADAADACPGTALPDNIAELKKNRFAADADGVLLDGNGADAGYAVVDTGGCSALQIVTAAGLGGGHERFGITRGELEAWVAGL